MLLTILVSLLPDFNVQRERFQNGILYMKDRSNFTLATAEQFKTLKHSNAENLHYSLAQLLLEFY